MTDHIDAFLKALVDPEMWVRVSKVMLGGLMVVGGLFMLTGAAVLAPLGSAVGQAAASAAKGATS